ncbi:MAG: hypothetical protein CMJ96_06320 [Planctomycetes bacterium]|jgi:Lon protease-like protein|nr:hypothetical protein [Planctomycetota bacterium]MDP7245622.1 LON peptidase substrate-binding domain-containing protein [Planctomycetota bacterium]MDP7559556.1 LON peptidase substrate-binding domain-containing protein [Planctomycetota bacterium]|tara:strand:- start:9256 stop:9894 length:639 start_codon:yes stop_codon:yes gene_type:complete
MKNKAPLFALPNLLLYPGAKLPIFFSEPRHLAMLRDMQAKEGTLLACALLKGDWEEDYFDNPEVHPIAGLARFKIPSSFSGDDSIQLLGIGEGRIRIQQILKEGPFPEAEFELLQETEAPEGVSASLRRELLQAISTLADGQAMVDDSATLSWLSDILSLAMPISIERKYEIFAMLDVQKRAESTIAEIAKLKKEHSSFSVLTDNKTNPDLN